MDDIKAKEIIKVVEKIKEVLPDTKGKFKSNIACYFDTDGMLRIQFIYECFENETLSNDIEDEVLSAIYEVTKTHPDKSSKRIAGIMRKVDNNKFVTAGVSAFNLTYNVVLSHRVTRPSMRTLLGLE